MCLDAFLVVSRIEFVVFALFLCSFWGRLIRGSRAGESQFKTAYVVLTGSRRSVCIQLLAVLKHTSLSRLFREQSARLARRESPHPLHRRGRGVGTR